MAEFTSEIAITTKVLIDGDKSLTGTVTAVIFRQSSASYEISYIHNGSSYSVTIESWRVTRAPY